MLGRTLRGHPRLRRSFLAYVFLLHLYVVFSCLLGWVWLYMCRGIRESIARLWLISILLSFSLMSMLGCASSMIKIWPSYCNIETQPNVIFHPGTKQQLQPAMFQNFWQNIWVVALLCYHLIILFLRLFENNSHCSHISGKCILVFYIMVPIWYFHILLETFKLVKACYFHF